MVRYCCVKNCKRKNGFAFPRDINLRTQWLNALDDEEFLTKEVDEVDKAVICDRHFQKSDLYENYSDAPVKRKKLRSGAVPSLDLYLTDCATTTIENIDNGKDSEKSDSPLVQLDDDASTLKSNTNVQSTTTSNNNHVPDESCTTAESMCELTKSSAPQPVINNKTNESADIQPVCSANPSEKNSEIDDDIQIVDERSMKIASMLHQNNRFERKVLEHRKDLKANVNRYRCCFVLDCTNTTDSIPEKDFFCLPRGAERRTVWCKAAGCSEKAVKSNYCCEDHFNLKQDLKNYRQSQTKGVRKVLKPEAVPRFFPHQFKKKTVNTSSRLSTNSTDPLDLDHSTNQIFIKEDFEEQECQKDNENVGNDDHRYGVFVDVNQIKTEVIHFKADSSINGDSSGKPIKGHTNKISGDTKLYVETSTNQTETLTRNCFTSDKSWNMFRDYVITQRKKVSDLNKQIRLLEKKNRCLMKRSTIKK